ncbi:MAG: peptide deformylase [Elusimicrobiota bacterium]
MGALKICKLGEPVLRQKCKAVKEITSEVRLLISDMLRTLYAVPGVGLAANQVGVPVRVCVIDVGLDGKRQPMALINPVLVKGEGKMEAEEGCLSLPGMWAPVKRFKKVQVNAINEMGIPVTIVGEDLLARALQHEIDHLNGKMFIDYLTAPQKKAIAKEIKDRKKKGEW